MKCEVAGGVLWLFNRIIVIPCQVILWNTLHLEKSFKLCIQSYSCKQCWKMIQQVAAPESHHIARGPNMTASPVRSSTFLQISRCIQIACFVQPRESQTYKALITQTIKKINNIHIWELEPVKLTSLLNKKLTLLIWLTKLLLVYFLSIHYPTANQLIR